MCRRKMINLQYKLRTYKFSFYLAKILIGAKYQIFNIIII